MNNSPQYKLFDVYEDRQLIGNYDTLRKVAFACNDYAESCDNECMFALYRKVSEDGTGAKYKLVKDWHYTANNVIIG